MTKRTHYRNGDEIGLITCGCDGCSPATINGVLCHEHGCPDAWRDYTTECDECGCDFHPSSRGQCLCDGCACPPDADDEYDSTDVTIATADGMCDYWRD